jgi:hypothetical protein
VSPKRRFLEELHGVTSQKTAFLILYCKIMKCSEVIVLRNGTRISSALHYTPWSVPIGVKTNLWILETVGGNRRMGVEARSEVVGTQESTHRHPCLEWDSNRRL